MPDSTAPAWREWSTAAFADAARAPRPVLLFLTVSWSAACAAMARDVLADPDVAAAIERSCVPVRVDADRRPDIGDRYGLGGWPTVAFLTPLGDVIGGGTYVDIPRMRQALRELDLAWRTRRAEIETRAVAARQARRARAACGQPGGELPADVDDRVADALAASYDPEWAGFGGAPRLPQPAPVIFSLGQGLRSGDGDALDRAIRTLDRHGWSAMSDAGSGAFHRACLTRDWQEPDRAVLLEVQADMIRLFLEAWAALGERRYLDRARRALHFVQEHLEEAAGGFRLAAGADGTLFTDAIARMARAYLQAAVVLDEPRWAERAVAALERVVPAVYARGAGVAHYFDAVPHVRGLLVDQVHVAAALLDTAAVADSAVHRELAEELMRSALRKLTDPRTGGLLDRLRTSAGAGDLGLLADSLVPYTLNCEAARVLARLGRETGQADLTAAAHRVLGSQTASYLDQGALAAEYALAWLDLQGGRGAGWHRGPWYTPRDRGFR